MLPLAAARRRYLSKQPPRAPDEAAIARGIAAAVRAEFGAAEGLAPLPGDARRRHMHYVLHRTNNPADVQPETLTREQVWAHIVRCYAEVYPREQSHSGSILMFGMVATEKHNNAEEERDRSPHHHVAVFCDSPHRWKQIRKLSADVYHIQLDAVAHKTYSTMYNYLRVPSHRKPVHELDPAPFFSRGHPQDDDLKEILRCGQRYVSGRRRGLATVQSDGGPPTKVPRSQFASVYEWVTRNRLRGERGATQFHLDAIAEMKAGRPHLLDFAKKHGDGLEDQIEFCWHVAEAARAQSTYVVSSMPPFHSSSPRPTLPRPAPRPAPPHPAPPPGEVAPPPPTPPQPAPRPGGAADPAFPRRPALPPGKRCSEGASRRTQYFPCAFHSPPQCFSFPFALSLGQLGARPLKSKMTINLAAESGPFGPARGRAGPVGPRSPRL